ncbi:MAG: L-lactate permease [Gemmatimonadota bacterium]|jgi:lactate permease
MTLGTQALLAVSPILLAGILLVGFRIPAKWAMPAVYAVAVFVAVSAWQMEWIRVWAASVQGLFLTFDLLFIIFGALLLLKTLEHSGGVAAIRKSFHAISDDRRVQIVLLGWLFGSFIEGASGFGTPAAVCAPLMVAMGFPAAAAVMIGMMIQSTAVTFGAVGTPVLVGVQGGVGGELFDAQLAAAGLGMREFLRLVTARAVVLHGIAGTLMPTLMVMMTTRFFGEKRSWTEGLSIIPFALFGGLAFTVPYTLTGLFLGPEFPTLLGAPIGLLVVTFAARTGFLVPKDSWEFPPVDRWDADWISGLEVKADGGQSRRELNTGMAWAPYLMLAVLLVLSRLPQLPFGEWLRMPRVAWEDIFGTGISGVTTPLYLPGFMLVLVVVLTVFLHRMPGRAFHRAIAESSRVLLGAGFVLVFTVPMVRVYINSDVNGAGFFSMPIAMAEWVATNVGQVWPMFAGVTGALGAFIAGSNTVSNLMFSAFQYGVAERLMISGALIVALQAVGAAAGNMIAIHNVVAASATVGLLGKEGATLRKTVLPTLYYLVVIGILGLVAVKMLGVGDPMMASPPPG